MEKQKRIYTVIIPIVVITVLLLTTICICKNEALRAMAVPQALLQGVSQEVFSRNIVPRNITPEISKIKSFLADAEMPKNTEVATNVRKAAENATNAWTECQELVNSKKVHLEYKRGEIYMAVHEDTAQRMYFHFSLLSETGKIKNCRKFVLTTGEDGNETRKTLYKMSFSDEFNIKTYKDPDGTVYFYPSDLIETIFYDTPDGKRYSTKWSEDGNVIRQGIYDMNNKGPLLLEAEEKAKKMLTENQERARKEYEEYKRKLNKEETGSSSNEGN